MEITLGSIIGMIVVGLIVFLLRRHSTRQDEDGVSVTLTDRTNGATREVRAHLDGYRLFDAASRVRASLRSLVASALVVRDDLSAMDTALGVDLGEVRLEGLQDVADEVHLGEDPHDPDVQLVRCDPRAVARAPRLPLGGGNRDRRRRAARPASPSCRRTCRCPAPGRSESSRR